MKYQWILFDADETLFNFDAYQGLKLMFSRYHTEFTQEDYQAYQEINKPLWVQYQDGDITATELQNTRFHGWSQRLDIPAQTLNEQFLIAMADICSLLPGAQELLDKLAPVANMGIITNGFTRLQTIRLEKLKLLDLFSPVVISEEVGITKPDVGIFKHTFDLIGNPDKNRILMVGDNPLSDILGGINAGIDTCWLNVNDCVKPSNIDPTYQVKSLFELQEVLFNK
ncbi:pyrimidine 5'-nucleotidase [Vibrio sp. SS-MA-C1-2]|uniref:pyrimidine 5'-nucleotidase n=1 Tax=Vibrio sp. SS-MA-C1-2 TaxID=2908646 RepID=UPI001F30DFAD|nr:pyrimidine 5'-nucleotidase [Vibrio sp. SS-MA-C1-2]UJF17696.1 pyrimidine 5'-nucleotidase [Vibrio sp. SS-MA-C1-2]